MTAGALDHRAHPGDHRAPAPAPPRAVAGVDVLRSLLAHDLDVVAPLLAAIYARPPWHAEAACRGTGPDSWFPNRTQGRPSPDLLDLCAHCPVRPECGEAGARERAGWWAGRPAPRSRRPRKAR